MLINQNIGYTKNVLKKYKPKKIIKLSDYSFQDEITEEINYKDIKTESYTFEVDEIHKIKHINFTNFVVEKIIYDGNFCNSIIENINLIDCGIGSNKLSNRKNIFFTGNKELINSVKIRFLNKVSKNCNIQFYNFCINSLIIENHTYDCKKIYFSNLKIGKNNKSKSILIDNIDIGKLELKKINNNFESFEIRNCKINTLIIKNSNLGKTVFNGVTIGKLELHNATLNDCIFNGVDFHDYELEEIKNGEVVDYKVMKDNYRQLKHVMDRNANYTEANKFYALEMDSLRNINYKYKSIPKEDIKELNLHK